MESVSLIISRYLARQIIFPTLAITGIIIFVSMSNWMRNWLADILAGEGGSGDILFIIFYYIPKFIQEALPAGFLMGILIGYGKLYTELEMTALFACGYKYKNLVVSTLKPAVLLMFLLWVNNFIISPWCLRQAAVAWAEQESMSPLELLKPGQFTSIGQKGEVIYVRSLDADTERLNDIFLSTSLNEVYKSESGFLRFNLETGYRYLILENGTLQNGQPGEPDYSISTFDSYGVRISSKSVKPRSTKSMQTLDVLWNSNENWAYSELQWRIFSPFNLIVALLIAIPMSRINPRQGRFIKIIPALVIYSLYTFAQDEWLRNISKGDFPRWMGLYVYQIAVAAGCLLLWLVPGWLNSWKVKRREV